jgi:hypothetical protein
MPMTPPRPSRTELIISAVVLVVLATIPLWTPAWWTALPFAGVFGGLAGGRWLRWFWSIPLGFAAGALAWGLELAVLPADPRSRLADVLGAAEGFSPTVFTLLGPMLFGLVTAVVAAALAGALRLATDWRAPPVSTVPAGAVGPRAHP